MCGLKADEVTERGDEQRGDLRKGQASESYQTERHSRCDSDCLLGHLVIWTLELLLIVRASC